MSETHPPYGSNPYDSSPYGWPEPPGSSVAAPPPPPPPSSPSPGAGGGGRDGGSGFRRRTVALFFAATLAAGATGAGITLVADGGDGPSNGATGTTILQRSGTGSNASQETVSGTPESAAATIAPSVVTINVTGSQTVQGQFGRSQTEQVAGTGSGVVLSKDGYIVTNNHVISAALTGGSVNVVFSDGSTAKATIVGHDATSDLAVIKVAASDKLVPAVFANSDNLKVGQAVLAVGAPLGLSNTVTEGIVSTLHRPVRTGEAGASEQSVIDAIQTDAAINPGNSGGALVNLAGEVVGLNSAIATTSDSSGTSSQSGNIGVGFAIASNDVTEVAKELIDTGKAIHAQLGISVGDTQDATGASVEGVTAGGPAQSAGLQQGDVITKIDDRVVTDSDSLIVAVRAHDPGDSVTVTFTRNGQTQTAKATLATAASD